MSSIFCSNGTFKTPVKAFRTHGSEFLIYQVKHFDSVLWDDIYAARLCILYARPTKDIKEVLQSALDKQFINYLIVEVIV